MQYDWIELNRLAAGSTPIDNNDILDLHRHGIRAILTLTEQPLTIHSTIPASLFMQLGITYCHEPIPDMNPPDDATAIAALNFLEQMIAHSIPVFFHCFAGMGRTGTILHLFYLNRGLPLPEVQTRIAATRPQCTLISASQRQYVEQYAEQLALQDRTIV